MRFDFDHLTRPNRMGKFPSMEQCHLEGYRRYAFSIISTCPDGKKTFLLDSQSLNNPDPVSLPQGAKGFVFPKVWWVISLLFDW